MKEIITDATHAILYNHFEKIRPPEDIRPKLDFGYDYDGRVVEMYEIRPDWMDHSIIRHHPFAKIRYVKSKNIWKLYWFRASGKWNEYEPCPESSDLQTLLNCIQEDAYGCFYG
jgi:Protein of unknown function (DUF3024)